MKTPVLAMVILVKNEVDIIAENIRYHARHGVEHFVVMDNGSTDGTVELLETLKQQFSLHIEIDKTPYQQSKFMTRLARIAKKQFAATHVILNDADEFWCAKGHDSLISAIDLSLPVQCCPRVNMLYTASMAAQQRLYTDATWSVVAPIEYSREQQQRLAQVSLQLVKIKPKAIVRPVGLRYVKGGNHSAAHWLSWHRAPINRNITIYHYPIRSFAQFEKNIKMRAAIVDKSGVAMGAHYHRWIAQFRAGQLQASYQALLPTEQQVSVLASLNVIEQRPEIATKLFNNPAESDPLEMN